MNTTIADCAVIILAAGKSARFGSPKQLLSYRGQNLLRHTVDEALATGCQSVFVVLGANRKILRKELMDKPVIIVENEGWEEGMAASIRQGLKHIEGTIIRPDCVIFMVCDQPYVNASLLLKLIEKKQETGKAIVASSYPDESGINRMGTPVLFHKTIFPLLMALTGDRGARKFIADNPDKVATVSFPEGLTDIDTVADYELLKKTNDS